MKKKGFTLIELLAVIVILAVIALIATPAVLNIIEDSRRSAAESSTRNIVNAAKTYYATQIMQNNSIDKIDLLDGTLKYNGEQAKKGKVFFDNEGNAYLKLYINGYCVERDYNGVIASGKVEENECEIPEVAPKSEFDNEIGDAVYYNPVLNSYCTDYVEANSAQGNMSGCMKWYLIKEEEDYYVAIGDHNHSYNESTLQNANPDDFRQDLPSIDAMVTYMTNKAYGWNVISALPNFIDLLEFVPYFKNLEEEITSENYDDIILNYRRYVGNQIEKVRDKSELLYVETYGYLSFLGTTKEEFRLAEKLLRENCNEAMLPEFLYKDLIDSCDENLECQELAYLAVVGDTEPTAIVGSGMPLYYLYEYKGIDIDESPLNYANYRYTIRIPK